MTDSESEFEHDRSLEAWVRASVDRRADGTDPRPLFERIRRTMRAERADGASGVGTDQGRARQGRLPARRRIVRWAGGLAAAAAVVVVTFLFGLHTSPAYASAEAVLREAQRVHQIPMDRCYQVEVRRDSDLLDESYPMTSRSRLTRVWTRGDRFWLETVNPQRQWTWGRDDRGRFWIAFGTRRGILYEPDEVPRWFQFSVDLYGMQPDKLLGEVLRDFDLTREPVAKGQPGTTIVVRATLKPGRSHPSLRGARLEFDAETKVVRKLVLERTGSGRPVATITYTLVDALPRPDRSFELEGHLEAPYEVYTRDHEPEKRRELVSRWLAVQAPERLRTTSRPAAQTRPSAD